MIDNKPMMMLNETRTCVVCRQPLPWKSRMTMAAVPQQEARDRGWTGQRNPDTTLGVDMCLPCQMARSKRQHAGAAQV
jgi:hypothetical protein